MSFSSNNTLVLGAIALFAAPACTSILGDFTIGTGTGATGTGGAGGSSSTGSSSAAATGSGGATTGANVECNENVECDGGFCESGACVPASCTDGAKNGSETDVDCGGGGACPPCTSGQSCVDDTDCESGACTPGFLCQ